MGISRVHHSVHAVFDSLPTLTGRDPCAWLDRSRYCALLCFCSQAPKKHSVTLMHAYGNGQSAYRRQKIITSDTSQPSGQFTLAETPSYLAISMPYIRTQNLV